MAGSILPNWRKDYWVVHRHAGQAVCIIHFHFNNNAFKTHYGTGKDSSKHEEDFIRLPSLPYFQTAFKIPAINQADAEHQGLRRVDNIFEHELGRREPHTNVPSSSKATGISLLLSHRGYLYPYIYFNYSYWV
jgi:hypothetical protein